MDEQHRQRVEALAALYRRHFEASSYKEGARALEEAEAYQRQLVEDFGEEVARALDAAAYAIGHG